MNLPLWLRQRFCSHEARAENIKRVPAGYVEVRCEKCGKTLAAPYGLALPVRWL